MTNNLYQLINLRVRLYTAWFSSIPAGRWVFGAVLVACITAVALAIHADEVRQTTMRREAQCRHEGRAWREIGDAVWACVPKEGK